MAGSKSRVSSRFKGSLYIIVGLAPLVVVLNYFIFPVMPSCSCPEIPYGYNPVRSILLPLLSIFVIFQALIGVVVVVLGYYTARYGGFTLKRFRKGSIYADEF